MNLRVSRCPACGNTEFRIERLACTNCGTAVEGKFSVSRLATLPDEQVAFVETFLKCRGNIKEVERELGLSYPTVRARLDEIVRALGLSPQPEVPRELRDELLAKLEAGEINADEFLHRLDEAAS